MGIYSPVESQVGDSNPFELSFLKSVIEILCNQPWVLLSIVFLDFFFGQLLVLKNDWISLFFGLDLPSRGIVLNLLE